MHTGTCLDVGRYCALTRYSSILFEINVWRLISDITSILSHCLSLSRPRQCDKTGDRAIFTVEIGILLLQKSIYKTGEMSEISHHAKVLRGN